MIIDLPSILLWKSKYLVDQGVQAHALPSLSTNKESYTDMGP